MAFARSSRTPSRPSRATADVARVVTRGGLRLECDFVVAGVGIEPAVEIADGSGIGLDNGVIVDEFLETTVSGVFAAGDVANHYHPLFRRHIRLEHWQNAVRQGAAAAHNMLGRRSSYQEIPWFWSDQYDVNLQYAGFHTTWEQMVVRGRLDAGNFLACYINNGRVDAAVGLNRARDIRRILPLIRSRASVDLDRLQDESVDLRTVAE
jgi:3-phenylpropionate/trans-cinnamate dioxygenase ferredoxin reductase component